jgi:hypothetical protein
MKWIVAFLWVVLALLGSAPSAQGQGAPTRGWRVSFDKEVLLPCSAPERVLSDAAGNTYLVGGKIAKYDAQGREAWQAELEGAEFFNAADCDLQGNLAVAYESYGDDRGQIARYDPDGNLLWNAPWVEPEGDDWGYIGAVEVVPDGGVLAFGADAWMMTTAKYGPVGDGAGPLWVSRTMGQGDARDPLAVVDAGPLGSYSVEGPGGGGGCILRNTPDGGLAWVIPLGFEVMDAGPAPGGDLYVVGSGGEMIDDRPVYFIVVIRIDSEGDIVWERRYGAPDEPWNYPRAVAWSDDGKVAVGGSAGNDFLTILLDADGQILWDARRPPGGAPLGWPGISTVAFDADGSVYAGGSRLDGPDAFSGVLIRYDPAGREAFSVVWGGAGKPATIRSVVSGLEGRSTVVLDLGHQSICSIWPWDEKNLIRLDASGREVWASQYCRTWTDTFVVSDTGMDGRGNIYLAGGYRILCQRSPAVTKVAPDGSVLWTHDTGITHSLEPRGLLAVDASGNSTLAALASCTLGALGGGCIRSVRFDPGGREVWSAEYGEEGFLSVPSGIAAAPDGGAWVTGGVREHPVTIRYGPQGEEVWSSTLVGGSLMAAKSFQFGGRWYDTLWFGGGWHLAFRRMDEEFFTYSLPPENEWGWDFPGYIAALATDGTYIFVAGGLPVPSWEPWRPVAGIRKYNPTGSWLQGIWTYELENHSIFSPKSLAFDREGNLVAAADRTDAPGWTVVKLDPGGNLIWKSSLDLAQFGPIADMAVDARNGIVVTGGLGTGGAAIAAWDSAGNISWVDHEEFPGGGFAFLKVLADPWGNAYLVRTVIWNKEINPPSGASTDITQYLRLPAAEVEFVRGDANGDGGIDIADPIAVLFGLFAGDHLFCRKAADANDDGKVGIPDAVFSLEYLFLDKRAPAAPFPRCGVDGVADDLACDSFPPCQ